MLGRGSPSGERGPLCVHSVTSIPAAPSCTLTELGSEEQCCPPCSPSSLPRLLPPPQWPPPVRPIISTAAAQPQGSKILQIVARTNASRHHQMYPAKTNITSSGEPQLCMKKPLIRILFDQSQTTSGCFRQCRSEGMPNFSLCSMPFKSYGTLLREWFKRHV